MVHIKLLPNGSFNVDGAGITVVQHKSVKAIGVREEKQKLSPPSAERVDEAKFVTRMSN